LIVSVPCLARRLLWVISGVTFDVIGSTKVEALIWFGVISDPDRRDLERLIRRWIVPLDVAITNQRSRYTIRHPSRLVA